MAEMNFSIYRYFLAAAVLNMLVKTTMGSNNIKSFFVKPDDSYRKYNCVKSRVLNLPILDCSMICCLQHRCLGLYHKKETGECYLINSITKEENCVQLDWITWKAYKKERVFAVCSQYLANYAHGNPAELDYVPSNSGDVGGFNVTGSFIGITLRNHHNVRGFAIQGRWRNESLTSCCDHRVTYLNFEYSADTKIWIWSDNKAMYEANVIPDAGNEVVFNMFKTPVYARFFRFYPRYYNGEKIMRFDVIGC